AVRRLSKKLPSFNPVSGEIMAWAKLDNETYYKGIAASAQEVRSIKCADRIDNLRSCKIWPKERRARYVKETEDFVLPIARTLDDSWFLKELERSIEKAA
ncbi:MAG: hypothetical protein Q7S28_00190, partial [bacterium]|nr:hypothetical protein [bacterium]